jgi:hypothetical protein
MHNIRVYYKFINCAIQLSWKLYIAHIRPECCAVGIFLRINVVINGWIV